MKYICTSAGCNHTYDAALPIKGASHQCPAAGGKYVPLKEQA